MNGYYVSADPPGVRVVYEWTPPDSGMPAARYLIEMKVNGEVVGSFTTETAAPTWGFDWTYEDETTVTIRVAGVDELERVGLFSGWAENYTLEGPPGAPTNLIVRIEIG